MNTEISFIDKKNRKFTAQTLKSIRIIEEEGKFPTATLSLDILEYNDIYGFELCEIKRDEELLFKGKITSLKIDGNELKIELQVSINSDVPRTELSVGIIKKLKEDNPELFTPLQTLDFSSKGEIFQSDLLIPEKSMPIEDNIIAPIKIEQNFDSPISEINLLVKGAWVSKREGNIGISTKIANRFKMAKINTLTPKKLVNSWPQFGEKFSGKSRATKYYVGQSRLHEKETRPLPIIKLSPEIPPICLNKHVFDHKLSIAWDYDQYMTETASLKIKNKTTEMRPALNTLNLLNLNLKPTSLPENKKELYINLKNVQEYIADPSELSFFSSKNGKLILNEIIKSAVNYIILSMRNLEISFECFETEELRNLTCHNWITFNGTDYKIIKIEKELSYNTNRLFITARGFGFKLSKIQDFMEPLNITKQETPTIRAEDIIEDIAIQNEADKQYEKLLNYISVLKKSNGITPANYKSLISKFLNENQTKIQIITKPLKTQHCENKTMDLGEIFIG